MLKQQPLLEKWTHSVRESLNARAQDTQRPSQATGGQALRREAGGSWRELAACNWSGHQTCLSIVNLPAPLPAPVDKPGHGRPVSGLRAPGFTGLQRPRIPASSGNYLHNYRHSEILSTDCVGALRQSRHTFSRLTLRPPGQSCIGPAIPTSETGRLMLRATISPQSHTANKGHSQNLNPEPIRSKNLSGSSVHGAPRLC